MKRMKWSLRFSIATLSLISVLGTCFPSADARTARSTITFENRSGEPALVKLVGLTAQRKYSLMAAEEARQLVEKIIKNKEVPPPGHMTTYWKLPETGLYAQGVKINDNGYIVFAPAEPKIIVYRAADNLLVLLPKMEKAIISGTQERKGITFLLNGILFATVNFEVVNKPTFVHSQNGEWRRELPILEKGGYKWSVGAVGILLEKDHNERLISFEEPSGDLH